MPSPGSCALEGEAGPIRPERNGVNTATQTHVELRVRGMTCASCAVRIEREQMCIRDRR